MANIRERMFELHEVDLSNPVKTRTDENGEPLPAFERVDYDAATAMEEIAAYKDKLKNLGNINPGALEDYEAEKARLDEVNRQYQDLEKARLGLEKAIKKLDKVAREQFLETFAVVQKNFQEVFSSLFEGGEAQLALEDNVDPLDAKIEINARPTGKKMRGVSPPLRRRARPHGHLPAVRPVPGAPLALLHHGRGGRPAGRRQYRPLREPAAALQPPDPVHRGDPQQAHHGGLGHALRRDPGDQGHLQAGERAAGRGEPAIAA